MSDLKNVHHIPAWIACICAITVAAFGFINTDKNNDLVLQAQFNTITTKLELTAAQLSGISTMQQQYSVSIDRLIDRVNSHETRITVLEVQHTSAEPTDKQLHKSHSD
jgi:hypothetical protein